MSEDCEWILAEFRKDRRAMCKLGYQFCKELGEDLPVGFEKASLEENYKQVFDIMKRQRDELIYIIKTTVEDRGIKSLAPCVRERYGLDNPLTS